MYPILTECVTVFFKASCLMVHLHQEALQMGIHIENMGDNLNDHRNCSLMNELYNLAGA